MKTKMCKKCKIEKPLFEFYKRKKENNLYCSHCKKCMNEYNKNWLKNNQEKVKLRTKKYREENKEKLKASDNLHKSNKLNWKLEK